MKTTEFRLIYDEGNYGVDFGFGIAFDYKGKLCRAAIKMSDNGIVISAAEFKKAWKELCEAVENPEAPGSQVVFEKTRLSGCEIPL